MSETKLETLIHQDKIGNIALHRREMSWHKTELTRLEKDIIHLILAGAEIEPGRFSAKVKFKSQHILSWKSVVLHELGKEFADAQWRASRIIRIPHLDIIEHPPLELFDRAS